MAEKIGLVAAMPDEIRPLIRRVAPVTREKRAGFTIYRFVKGGKDVTLIESGIGTERAARATRTLMEAATPGLILNFGFGGAVRPGPAVGDIVVANRLLLFKERLFSEQQGVTPALLPDLIRALERLQDGINIHQGTFITTGEIIGKRMLAGLLPTGAAHPVLEMESAAVARVAHGMNVPFAAIRAISDGADEELGFSIADFTDREMRIRTWKVLWTLARKPGILPQLLRLGKNSRRAGENLATAVMAVLDSSPA